MMEIEPTALQGVYLLKFKPIHDERGFFVRTFCQEAFKRHGLHATFVQHNLSQNKWAGTVRGLHYQTEPFAEVKVISCQRGTLFDVVVDLRKSSKTYGQWISFTLSSQMHEAIYVDKGFAHGFQTLEDNTEVNYLMSCGYEPTAADGVRYDDPVLQIPWPRIVSQISKRDLLFPQLKQ